MKKFAVLLTTLCFSLVALMSVTLDSTETAAEITVPTVTTSVATPTARVYLPLLQRSSSLVVSVRPLEPRAGDVVQIELSGIWYSTCPAAVAHDAIVIRRGIVYVLVGVTDAWYHCPLIPCAQRGTYDSCLQRWTIQEELKHLSPGTYEVVASLISPGRPRFKEFGQAIEVLSTAHTRFTVAP